MKRTIISLSLILSSFATFSQGIGGWNFQFGFETMDGTSMGTTPVTTYNSDNQTPFMHVGTADLSAYLCEGQEFNLYNLSNGTYNNCQSGMETIGSSTPWDVAFGGITSNGTPSVPYFTQTGSYILQNEVWPWLSGLPISIPNNSAPTNSLELGSNNDPDFVYYTLMIAPHMGCQYFGVHNTSAGCANLLYITIKVKRAPVPLENLTICPNTLVNDDLLGIPSGTTASRWFPSDPRIITPSETTTYTYQLSNGACPYNGELTVTVTTPTAELFENIHTQMCPSSLPLLGNNVINTGAQTITVNGSLVYNNPTILNTPYVNSNEQIQITTPGEYTIVMNFSKTVFSGTHPNITSKIYYCSKTYTVNVSDISIPNFTQVMCNSNFQPLCAPTAPNGSVYSYQWFGPLHKNQSVLLSTSPCFTPSSFGSYSLEVTDQNGCSATSQFTLTLSPSANPSTTIFTYLGTPVNNGDSVIYDVTPGSSNTYNTWHIHTCNQDGGNQSVLPIHTVTTNGIQHALFPAVPAAQHYTIILVSASLPCMVEATTSLRIYTAKKSGSKRKSKAIEQIEVQVENIQLEVFPNPNQGIFTINAITKLEGTIDIYSSVGRKVKSISLDENKAEFTVDLSDYAKGIYIVHLSSEDQSIIKKIIIE